MKRLLVLLAACGSSPGITPDAATPDGAVDGAVDGAAAITCSGKSAQPRDAVWTIDAGGLQRVVNVHVPASYDPSHGVPLVLDFHGFTSDSVQEIILSRTDAKSDAVGFISMHPLGVGVPRSWNAGACCGYAAMAHVDDIAFVRALLDTAAAKLCIDPHRIYATGMSNGAFFSHRIACELGDRFAAVAPVAGTLGMPTCTPVRPMPVMAFNGTADLLVPYNGDPVLGFPPVLDTFHGWAMRDGCTGNPVVTFEHGDARCETFEQCTAGATVTQCTIEGGGHTWPGGLPVPALGYTSNDISATDAMWTFFAAHPLP